jgi:cell division transport system ATP-binding protein
VLVILSLTDTRSRTRRGRLFGRARSRLAAEPAVLALRDVTKTYPNGKNALRDVDLIIPEGDFVFLVGPSGAGKSTLIKLLIRDELATRGQVIIDGQDLARLSRRQVPKIRRKIGIVFQDFKLLPSKNVWENVAFALEVTGTPHGKIRPAVDRVLALVGLTAQARQVPGQLSGGEQQRVALARAFVPRPKVILADEPTGNLDGTTGEHVIDLLFALSAQHGTTLLLVTHNPALARRCEREIRLVDGRIANGVA